jgi:uncharacterized protein YutE (UPF0331/DUF86 family)
VTPRRFDPDVVDRRLADVRLAVQRLQELGDLDAEQLDNELAEQLAPSAGLRNILVHGYDEVDLDALAAGAGMAVSMFPRYVEQVAAFTRERVDTSDVERDADDVDGPTSSA